MRDRTSRPSGDASPLLGCIADDVTGATDLSLNLVQGGLRVVQFLGIPAADELCELAAEGIVEGIVIALKSRSVPAAAAVDLSLAALKSLRTAGCRRFYFKYCSTFDSTDEGNIGPVAEALLQAVGGTQAIFCPAFPAAGRTVYLGHLFVQDCLLHESGMQNHPLNPMRDPNLVRVLTRQSKAQVGLLPYSDVSAGPQAILSRLSFLREEGRMLVIADALTDEHLQSLASASADASLVTGGSALARYLPDAYRAQRLLTSQPFTPVMPQVTGRSAILSGSCSRATLAQVARQSNRCAACQIDFSVLMLHPDREHRRILAWIGAQPESQPVLIYSTAEPGDVERLQAEFGREALAGEIERLLGRVAQALVNDHRVRRLIVAGGETSAAVANALGVRALRIGPEIAPGVPWTESVGRRELALAFKSGNFGDEDFFHTALEMFG